MHAISNNTIECFEIDQIKSFDMYIRVFDLIFNHETQKLS